MYVVFYTRDGQKVLAIIFFLFTRVHLHKEGSVYISFFVFLSVMSRNIESITRMLKRERQHKDAAFWALPIEPNW